MTAASRSTTTVSDTPATPPAPRPLALSPSRANDYQECPLKYRFRAIDRLPEPKTIAMLKGTLVHAVLEELHKLPRAERTLAKATEFIPIQWDTMREDDTAIDELVPDSDRSEFFNDAWRLVRGYFAMENPESFDAHECEMYVDTTLPNGVPVRGYIDRVDVAPTGEVRVVDYKTGKKPLPRYSAAAKFQMRLYALVWWRLFNQIPAQLRLMYLKVGEDLTLRPNSAELEYFEKDLATLWESIVADAKSGNFQPRTSKLCGWCHFKPQCPAFGGTPPEYPGVPAGLE